MTEPSDRRSGDRKDGHTPLRYATDYHTPVLSKTVVDGLITDRTGLYVDATLGGGGHSQALLDALEPEGHVLGIDRDVDALATARERLGDAEATDRFTGVRGNFAKLASLLREHDAVPVDGLLLDLGVSSHQIDTAERGFSFQAEAPLDMRMDRRSGTTADEIVNAWSRKALHRLLKDYGEERRASRIARVVVDARPIHTTTELAAVVRGSVPERDEVKTLARVFQAIRIAVNAELEALEHALEASVEVLRPGGRIAVISYHSLEDRRVKRFFRYGNFEGEPVHDLYGNLLAPLEELNRKPLMADEAEVTANPRARSARLRIAERRPDEAWQRDAAPPSGL